jgi:hypothetical protein
MKVGDRQEIETLINEEAFLFAKYLRGEKTHWEPRIAELKQARAFMFIYFNFQFEN